MKTARPHACGFAFPLPPSAFPSSFILHPYPSMQHCDALIVGGGPAGATCAAALRRRGLDVVVLDKATFPRAKLCAGWITPELFQTLAVDPAEYGRGRVLQAMTAFRVGRIGGPHVVVSYDRPVSFGIRRSELDDFLLRRAGAHLRLGEAVQAIERQGGRWLVNGQIATPLLVAAGGHFCPVARLLGMAPPPREPVVAAEEFEIELSPPEQDRWPVDPQVPEIYFCDDLMGYGWCIRKGPLLNVGLGREDGRALPEHVRGFCDFLKQQGRGVEGPAKFAGHAYQLYDHSTRPLLADGVLWIGDAAGLAATQSGEGIRPAVESGLLAARAIAAAGGDYRRERLASYARAMEARFGRRRVHPVAASAPGALRRLLGRKLLAQRWFVRRVVLDRWFLHAGQTPLEPEAEL
ncbi:MAG: NAD(P)/FAD-dependent oxidoreductase [Thermoguttaceae bacterium]